MSNSEKARYDQSYYDRIYQEVVHINDEEVVAQFMEKQMENPEDALAYLSQWDHGDVDSEKLTYSQIIEGLTHVNYVSNAIYLALWQTGIDGVSLYRALTEEKSSNEEDSQKLSDEERFILSEGLISLMTNVQALKAILYDEEVNQALDAYIAKIKRLLPIVQLRTSAVCVFSMHGKCLIHEVKPAVCALYPLGRFTKYGSDSYEIRYFLQDVSCGTKDQENVVEDWLKNLGPDHEECAHIWHSMISEFIPLIEDIPKTDTSRTEKLAVVIFELAYGKYDYNKDFLPQFKERLEIIKEFCKVSLKV